MSPWRLAAAVAMLAVGVSVLTFAMQRNVAANRDFICYWAAGQQLIYHQNPYDSQAILRLERSAGFADTRPFFMRNPPLAFFLALPLGLIGEKTGAILWSLAIVAALMGSIRLLWILCGRPPDRLKLIGYIFPPALACLLAGQIAIFLLLSVTLFLYFHRSRPFFAGSVLILCALKPHLFLPLGVALIAWVVTVGAYRILIGAGAALLASLAIALYFDPAGWSHYAQMARGASLQQEFIPTLSFAFRMIVHRDAAWLQFLPALGGCVWALSYFRTRRRQWNWMDQGAVVLVASVMLAPYAWFTDEAIVLPAILASLYRASYAERSLVPFGCIAGVALIEVFCGVVVNSGFYIWTAPAWLAWYLHATHGTSLPPLATDSLGPASPAEAIT